MQLSSETRCSVGDPESLFLVYLCFVRNSHLDSTASPSLASQKYMECLLMSALVELFELEFAHLTLFLCFVFAVSVRRAAKHLIREQDGKKQK
jgi:hypothetical protein